jgi:hypothetical protein
MAGRKTRVSWVVPDERPFEQDSGVDKEWIDSIKRGWNGKRANDSFGKLGLAPQTTSEKRRGSGVKKRDPSPIITKNPRGCRSTERPTSLLTTKPERSIREPRVDPTILIEPSRNRKTALGITLKTSASLSPIQYVSIEAKPTIVSPSLTVHHPPGSVGGNTPHVTNVASIIARL